MAELGSSTGRRCPARGGRAIYTREPPRERSRNRLLAKFSLVTNAGRVSIPNPGNPDDIRRSKRGQESIEFWVDGANLAKQMTIEAVPTTGSLRILSLGNPDQPWIRVIPMSEPFIASETQAIEMAVEIDSSRIARSRLVPGSRHPVRVDVEYEGPHGPAIAPLVLALIIRTGRR